MVGAVRSNPDIGPTKGSTDTAAGKPAEKKENPNKSAIEQIHKDLHDNPEKIGTYNFKKIQKGEAKDSPELENVLSRYKVDGVNKHNSAVLSSDGNTAVVITDGVTALKNGCGGTNWFTRGFNMLFGWIGRIFGSPDNRTFAKRYKELFNTAEAQDPNSMVHESLSHLMKAFKQNHYHAVHVFHKDPESGKFTKTPDAVAVTDSYYMVMDAHQKIEDKDRAKILEEMKKDYKNVYALDKIIPITKSGGALKDVFHQVSEGLYQAQGFDMLTVPGQVHANPNVETNDLHYEEVPFHAVVQNQKGEWKIFGDKGLLDDEATFKSNDEKENYLKHLIDQPRHLTIVSPKTADKKIDRLAHNNALGHFANWINMYSGGKVRTDKKEDKELIEKANNVNANLMYKKQTEREVAHKIAEKLEKPEKADDDKEGWMKKLMAGLGKN